jgi:hypothetical protein
MGLAKVIVRVVLTLVQTNDEELVFLFAGLAL